MESGFDLSFLMIDLHFLIESASRLRVEIPVARTFGDVESDSRVS